MLLNLPHELLTDIASYLSSSGKLQLALTCKKLKDTIFERCFYETLDLIPKPEKAEKAVLTFQQEQSKGQKVKILLIDLDYLPDQLFEEIPLIFPNLVKFYDASDHQNPWPKELFKNFIQWKDSLRYLKPCYNPVDDIFYELLEKNVFSRLTNLYIYDSHVKVLKCIKHAPALENLTLKQYTITLKVIEKIHSRSPLLSTFKIIDGTVLVDGNESLPKKITPALRLFHFILDYTTIRDQQCIFLDYITRKYTNLIKLEFDPVFPQEYLAPIFSGRDAKKDEALATYERYSNSISETLSNLPCTLKLLQISSIDIYSPMTIFSKKCIYLTQIDLRTCDVVFTSPEEIAIFKNLPLLKRLSMMIDPLLQKYKRPPASTTVTRLDTTIKETSPHDDMDLGWILSMFPSLDNLNIRSSGPMLIVCEDDSPKSYPNLIRLSISPGAIHPNFLKLIYNIAPNLEDSH